MKKFVLVLTASLAVLAACLYFGQRNSMEVVQPAQYEMTAGLFGDLWNSFLRWLGIGDNGKVTPVLGPGEYIDDHGQIILAHPVLEEEWC